VLILVSLTVARNRFLRGKAPNMEHKLVEDGLHCAEKSISQGKDPLLIAEKIATNIATTHIVSSLAVTYFGCRSSRSSKIKCF
jgi:hypothetical protein